MCMVVMPALEEEMVVGHVTSSWLSALDNLIAIGRSPMGSEGDPKTYDTGLLLWRDMGRKMRIVTEDVLRNKMALDRSQTLGALPHCEWLRCPLHEGGDAVPGRDMMVCAGCHSVRPVPFTSFSSFNLTAFI